MLVVALHALEAPIQPDVLAELAARPVERFEPWALPTVEPPSPGPGWGVMELRLEGGVFTRRGASQQRWGWWLRLALRGDFGPESPR